MFMVIHIIDIATTQTLRESKKVPWEKQQHTNTLWWGSVIILRDRETEEWKVTVIHKNLGRLYPHFIILFMVC